MNTRGIATTACCCLLLLGVTACGKDAPATYTVGATRVIDPTERPTETTPPAPCPSPDPGSTATACEPGATPSASSAAATSAGKPSASATAAPVLPAVAKTNTQAGAEAFARWYIEMLNYLGKTGKGDYPDVADPTCKSCARDAARVAKYRAEGLSTSGDRLAITGVQSAAYGTNWLVSVHTNELPINVIDSSGTVIATGKTGRGIQQPELRWAGDGWKIVAIRGEAVK